MCMPKAPKQQKAPEPLTQPLAVADELKAPDDDLTITRSSRGASALSRGRGSVGTGKTSSGLGI